MTKEVDDFGLETIVRGKKGKSKINAGPKTRQSQRRKTLQKPRYVFVKASTNNQAYKDYFDPNQEVEKRLLGLSDLVFLHLTLYRPLLMDLPARNQDASHKGGKWYKIRTRRCTCVHRCVCTLLIGLVLLQGSYRCCANTAMRIGDRRRVYVSKLCWFSDPRGDSSTGTCRPSWHRADHL